MYFSMNNSPVPYDHCSVRMWGCQYWCAITAPNVLPPHKGGIRMPTTSSDRRLILLRSFIFRKIHRWKWGPTEIVPGTHFSPAQRDAEHEGVPTSGPAGTFALHSQSILHRRGESTGKGLRHMLKYNYWRTMPPKRDWIVEPNFDFHRAYYGGHRVARYVAHMFYWLCGKGDEFRVVGGQGWPWRTENQIGPSYGFGVSRGYLPDWRQNNGDGYAN